MFQKSSSMSGQTGKRILKPHKTKGKRGPRYSSNIFAMFEESQIQEFKEAFNMIDQNRDGLIDKEDLGDMLASLGELSVYESSLVSQVRWQSHRLYCVKHSKKLSINKT